MLHALQHRFLAAFYFVCDIPLRNIFFYHGDSGRGRGVRLNSTVAREPLTSPSHFQDQKKGTRLYAYTIPYVLDNRHGIYVAQHVSYRPHNHMASTVAHPGKIIT